MSVPSPENLASQNDASRWSCLFCGGGSARDFQVEGHWVRKCQACDHRFAEIVPASQHIDEVYDDGYFFGDGAGYHDYLAESRLLIARGARYGKMAKQWIAVGKAFDVGAAAGFTLQGLKSQGWEVSGLEPNATMASFAKKEFGIDVAATSLEAFSPPTQYELVTGLQILPHFADPKAALAKMAAMTAAGGVVLVETWDEASRTARWAGHGWHAYNPPSTLHWFSRRSLRDLAAKVGLEWIGDGRQTKWIDAAHAKNILAHKIKSTWLRAAILGPAVLIPNRLAIPYLADDLFWAAFRKRG